MRNTNIKYLLLALMAAVLLSGCAAAVIGGAAAGATAAHDRRTVGNFIDDQAIEVKARSNINKAEAIGKQDHIKVTSYNGVVLLTGEVSNQGNLELAESIAAGVNGVREVKNELSVQDKTSLGARVDDSLLSTKVNTALLTNNPVPGFDPSRIKVVSVRDVVYLMGLVTEKEADDVTEVVRNVNGVAKVVRVFEYIE